MKDNDILTHTHKGSNIRAFTKKYLNSIQLKINLIAPARRQSDVRFVCYLTSKMTTNILLLLKKTVRYDMQSNFIVD